MTLEPKYFQFYWTSSPPQIRCIPIGEHQTVLHPQDNFPHMPPFKIEPGPWLRTILPSFRLSCRDPEYAYVIPVTTQSHGEPRSVPTCLSREGQAQNTLEKHRTCGASHPGQMIN